MNMPSGWLAALTTCQSLQRGFLLAVQLKLTLSTELDLSKQTPNSSSNALLPLLQGAVTSEKTNTVAVYTTQAIYLITLDDKVTVAIILIPKVALVSGHTSSLDLLKVTILLHFLSLRSSSYLFFPSCSVPMQYACLQERCWFFEVSLSL